MTLNDLFDEALSKKASDIHLAVGESPCLRIDGKLVRLDWPAVDPAAMKELIEQTVSGNLETSTIAGLAKRASHEAMRSAYDRLASGKSAERTLVHDGIAFAGIVFRVGTDGLAATFRVLGSGAPPLSRIGEGALELFQKIIDSPRGLAILAGPTGSGKWTTACSIVDRINETREERLFVVESRPSYHLTSKMGMLSQLHVGQECDSYEHAMELAHQADLDIIAVDDIPTVEALRQVLILADTGHLVIANLHADSAVDAIERLLAAAGQDSDALRKALAQNLVAVVGQRLVRRAAKPGRVPIYEWIVPTPSVRQAILSNDLVRLAELQHTDPECRSAMASTEALVRSGEIEG